MKKYQLSSFNLKVTSLSTNRCYINNLPNNERNVVYTNSGLIFISGVSFSCNILLPVCCVTGEIICHSLLNVSFILRLPGVFWKTRVEV